MTNKDTKSGDNIILEDGDNEIVDNNEVCEILMIILKILLPPSDLIMLLLVLMMLSINTIAIPVL